MKRYSIIKADIESDKNEIISLLQHADWNESYNTLDYDWKYLIAPFKTPKCWFAIENETDKLIGIASLFPRNIWVNRKPVNTFTLGDFYIEKKYRGFGLALLLQKNIYNESYQMKNKQLIFGIANKQSKVIAEKTGYTNMGAITQYIKPLYLSHIAEYKQHYPKILKIKTVQKMLDIFFSVTARERYRRKKNKYRIEIRHSFDKQFDIFWDKAVQGFNIISEKSSKILNWRYANHPREKYSIFSLKDNQQLLGYIVYAEINNNHQIYDLCYLKNQSILSDLLLEFSLYSRDKQISSIIMYYLGDKQIIRELRKFNFHPVSYHVQDLLVGTMHFDADESAMVNNPSNWNLLLGDKY
jgi:hypothetical protein